jgi:hypothetical protein
MAWGEAHAVNTFEGLAVERGNAGIALQRAVDAPKLRLADRCLQVGDAML